MKILMVSMSSIHFFKWTDHLKYSGHDVYWFDILDGCEKVNRINWVKQIVNWKHKYNYKGRHFIKDRFPKLYSYIQKFNENNLEEKFEQILLNVKPDIVHSFAMQIACIPIITIMQKYRGIKWIYSSWGSDMYFSKEIGIDNFKMKLVLARVDFLITDCQRDFNIAVSKGFRNKFLGVYPGNGGVNFPIDSILNLDKRKLIIVKGYHDDIGRALEIIKAICIIPIEIINKFNVLIYGADDIVVKYILNSDFFKNLNYEIFSKKQFIPNEKLLLLMGDSIIHLANSISDGIPNSTIEAMGMGAFPIQSNPGRVTEEIINNTVNGLLIENCNDYIEIARLIKEAIMNKKMLNDAFIMNTSNFQKKYDQKLLREKIQKLYEN